MSLLPCQMSQFLDRYPMQFPHEVCVLPSIIIPVGARCTGHGTQLSSPLVYLCSNPILIPSFPKWQVFHCERDAKMPLRFYFILGSVPPTVHINEFLLRHSSNVKRFKIVYCCVKGNASHPRMIKYTYLSSTYPSQCIECVESQTLLLSRCSGQQPHRHHH